MVTRFPQSRFERQPFNPPGLHLHTSTSEARESLVVLVHGFTGRGYGTWEALPGRLFDGRDGDPVDVGVYDYVSGPRRRLREGGANFQFCTDQLGADLRKIADEYKQVFLVGHSMGGLIIENVAMAFLQRRAMLRETDGAGPLSGLVFLAAPRAGSGLAVPLLRRLIPEFEVLGRLSQRSSDIDDFFSTWTDRSNTAEAAPGKTILPAFAVLGGSDRYVSSFSSAFGIPETQKLRIAAGHSKIAKPGDGDSELMRWLLNDVIRARVEVRRQESRQRSHGIGRNAPLDIEERSSVITKFSTDDRGLLWEEMYNDARQAITSSFVEVIDVRDAPKADVDLLISVHDAELVMQSAPRVRASIDSACAERRLRPAMAMGLSPVGARHAAAVAALQHWTSDISAGNSFYIEGVVDAHRLREVLARFIYLVLNRNPSLRREAWDEDSPFGTQTYSGSGDGGDA